MMCVETRPQKSLRHTEMRLHTLDQKNKKSGRGQPRTRRPHNRNRPRLKRDAWRDTAPKVHNRTVFLASPKQSSGNSDNIVVEKHTLWRPPCLRRNLPSKREKSTKRKPREIARARHLTGPLLTVSYMSFKKTASGSLTNSIKELQAAFCSSSSLVRTSRSYRVHSAWSHSTNCEIVRQSAILWM